MNTVETFDLEHVSADQLDQVKRTIEVQWHEKQRQQEKATVENDSIANQRAELLALIAEFETRMEKEADTVARIAHEKTQALNRAAAAIDTSQVLDAIKHDFDEMYPWFERALRSGLTSVFQDMDQSEKITNALRIAIAEIGQRWTYEIQCNPNDLARLTAARDQVALSKPVAARIVSSDAIPRGKCQFVGPVEIVEFELALDLDTCVGKLLEQASKAINEDEVAQL